MKKLLVIAIVGQFILACNYEGNYDKVRTDSIPRDSIDKTDVDEGNSRLIDSVKSQQDTSSYDRMSNKANDSIPD